MTKPSSARSVGTVIGLPFVLLLVALIVTIPLNIEHLVNAMGLPTPDLQRRVSVYLFDLPMALLVIAVAPVAAWFARIRRISLEGAIGSVVVSLVILSAAANPSPRGSDAVFRILGAFAIAFSVAQLRDPRVGWLVNAFLVILIFEEAIGIAQVLRGAPIGLTRLGEYPPLITFGASVSAKGTFVHHYIFGGFVLIGAAFFAGLANEESRVRWGYAAVAAASSFSFAFSYSRAGAVGLAGVFFLMMLSIRRWRAALVPGALILGFLAGFALSPDGWLLRFDQSFRPPVTPGMTRADVISTERFFLMSQATEMMKNHPILGAGAGYYMFELADQTGIPPTDDNLKPVHNVPMLIGAESGILAGLASFALLIALGFAALRGTLGARLLFVAYLPYLMLDHYPYDAPVGLAITGLWFGAILRLGRDRPDYGVEPAREGPEEISAPL